MINEQRSFQDLINRKEHERKSAETRVQKLEEEIKKYKAELQSFKETKQTTKRKNDIKLLEIRINYYKVKLLLFRRKLKNMSLLKNKMLKMRNLKAMMFFKKWRMGLQR